MTIEVCLVRHGPAGQRGPRWPDDSLRPLTPRGKGKMRAAARGLRALFEPEVIYTSPLRRARQTAQIIAKAMGGVEVRVTERLATGDELELLRELEWSGAKRILAVGHEPSISDTLSFALTGGTGTALTPFRKGAAALITADEPLENGRAALSWFLQPAALRAIGGRSA